MSNVGIALNILEDDESLTPGYNQSSGHLIFDVKIDFTRKARWVKDVYRTPDPVSSSYSGVLSREIIRILLTHSVIHGVPVTAEDVCNAYLQYLTSEKHYVICGPKFGLENIGKKAIITRAIYGGKAAGRYFWHHLRSFMTFLGVDYSQADPDVWMRKSIRKDEVTEYYEYVLIYTDDCLVVSYRVEAVLRNEIGKYFELKEESIGPL